MIMLDLEFEHCLLVLASLIAGASKSPRKKSFCHDLCRALRAAKLAYWNVVRTCGHAYDVTRLRRAVTAAARLLPELTHSRYYQSIERHVAETRKSLPPVSKPKRAKRHHRKRAPLAAA